MQGRANLRNLRNLRIPPLPSALLIANCEQLLTLRGGVRRGVALRETGVVENGAVLVRDGRLAAVGTQREVERAWKKLPPRERKATREIDAGGRIALPGFVDAHTHLIHAASRASEYEMRIAGATYEQIAAAGGGIASSVKKLRAASLNDLKQRALAHLKQFAAHGTTTVEAKSGYGLDLASEVKILRLHRELQGNQPGDVSFRRRSGSAGTSRNLLGTGLGSSRPQANGPKQLPRRVPMSRDETRDDNAQGWDHGASPIDIVSTFLGAHVPPPEFRGKADAYADLLIRKMIPKVAAEGLAEYCDVFCDVGAFTVAQARRILTAARACGLQLRVHAEQLTRTGSAQLAVALHAASCDHLEQINAEDIRALAASDTVATLLPGCSFHLGLQHYAPARALIDAGAIVALATDFNPGTSPTLSMPMVLSLACTQMRMTPAEAIAAATINAAYSLGRADRIGSLEVGKYADIAVFDLDDYREIPYYFGVNHCWLTLKRGDVCFGSMVGS
jgi:imidazolonepropionase